MKIKETLKKTPLYPAWHKFRLAQVDYREKKKRDSFRKYGTQILAEICDIAIEERYPLCCTWGTLLGLLRDGKLIPWDDDMDFWILPMDGFSWEELKRKMLRRGFSIYREVEEIDMCTSVTFRKKGVICDIGLFKNNGEQFISGGFEMPGEAYVNGEYSIYEGWAYKVPVIMGIHREVLNGIEVLLPDNAEEVAAALYGEEWRMPIQNYYDKKEDARTVKLRITYR